MVQLSYPHMTTGRPAGPTLDLQIQNLVNKMLMILMWIKVKRNISLLQLPHNIEETAKRSKPLKL